MKHALVCTLMLMGWLGTYCATAQSVVGNWMRTTTLVTYKSGRIMDVQAMMTKSVPCTARVTYEFLANGTQKTHVPADCQQLKSTMATLYADTRYTVRGNQITVVSPDAKLATDVTYAFTIQGNTMTWTLDYNTQPTRPNPEHVKVMTLTYKRL